MGHAELKICSDLKGLATEDIELREFEDSLCFSSDVKEEAPLVSGEVKVGSMGQYE